MSESSRRPRRSLGQAIRRIVGGIVVYGAIGFGLDRWWGTSFMVFTGAALGAALGIFTVYAATPHRS
ncbi:hypothetical protein FE697_009645 [Mumia zhuanghuii]|uniref:AtpZ/AtpI family protein n=2 Tax=Mumia TaxID=1546255 RepID=A0ABW1QPU3_9ACTN|nr:MULTISPECIES: AtpZ/AtpI family protein [Mumia]KAA1423816.1 hypothetical protein FE697_009645 [Mumia zhuanghuii]